MKVTDAMLDAAVRKAVEAGLFPRHGIESERAINRQLMWLVLQSALAEALAGDAAKTTPNHGSLSLVYTDGMRHDRQAGSKKD